MNIEWTILIAIAFVIVTNLVTLITLYVHLDNKTEKQIGKMRDLINHWKLTSDNMVYQIQKEMQDFHGRLCEIEAKNKK